jgi:hypothetical protein
MGSGLRDRVLIGSGDIGIGFKPDPTETAAPILTRYIGYVAANILRIGFKPYPFKPFKPYSF